MTERLLYPYDEARYLLGDIGKTRFSEMLARGELRRTSIGRRSFIHRDELIRYISSLDRSAAGEDEGASTDASR